MSQQVMPGGSAKGWEVPRAALPPFTPAVLPAIPRRAVPAMLADGAQLQAQVATAVGKVFTAKGPSPCIWQGMICGSRAAPSVSFGLPKAWAGQDFHGGILVQQEPIAPCMHLGCFLCFITSFHFLFSLWINNRPMCGHELYPLRAVSYKATGARAAAARTATCPTSLKRRTSRAVMGKGRSCLSSVPVWGCVHM